MDLNLPNLDLAQEHSPDTSSLVGGRVATRLSCYWLAIFLHQTVMTEGFGFRSVLLAMHLAASCVLLHYLHCSGGQTKQTSGLRSFNSHGREVYLQSYMLGTFTDSQLPS